MTTRNGSRVFAITVAMVVWNLMAVALMAQQPWQPEEFPISYWHGPPATSNHPETWQVVEDCNFTFCGPRGGYTVEENRQMLDFCQQIGIKAMIVDGRIGPRMVAREDWQETIAQIVSDFGSHPALYGYYLKDEPNYADFEALRQISGEFLRHDPNHLAYINLFPTYASTKQLGTPTYADHLDQYLSIVKPRVLSYDHYCLMRDGTDRPDYFENLSLIREHGLRYGVPPWNIILSLSHLAYRDPTAGEMRWQVYTSLAYGMKGIMWFTYWSEKSWEKDGEIGIVDSDGKPARLYPIVQQLNGEMKMLGRTLLGLTSTGVFHTGEIPAGCRRQGTDSLLSAPPDVPLVIGFFRDREGADYVMVVNSNHDEPVEVPLTFLPHVVSIAEISATDGMERPVESSDRQMKLQLAAGDGRLLKLTTSFDYPQPPKVLTAIDFQFDGDLQGWDGLQSLTEPVVKNGLVSLAFSGDDPSFSHTFLRIPPDTYAKLKLRMRLPPCNPSGQLFWTTSEEPNFEDDKYLNFPVVPDGEWHEYEIPVADHANWKGRSIQAIRLDPTTGGAASGSRVEIDWIVGE